jgi:hypothetical protein
MEPFESLHKRGYITKSKEEGPDPRPFERHQQIKQHPQISHPKS